MTPSATRQRAENRTQGQTPRERSLSESTQQLIASVLPFALSEQETVAHAILDGLPDDQPSDFLDAWIRF